MPNEPTVTNQALDRMTEPGIFIVGDQVIYGGEGEHFGVSSKTADRWIRAGTLDQLHQRGGDWVFVDLGFSRDNKTCGFLYLPESLPLGSAKPDAVALTFGALTKNVAEMVRQDGPPLHLVLEAPLSAAFGADGNPMGRSVEKQANKTRYWYAGLGCSVLVASLYLLKAIVDACPVREIRLFEGLVSFKDGTKPSDHIADVQILRDVVWSGGTQGGSFCEPAPLDSHRKASVVATLGLLGLEISPPPIVQGIAR
jgi:hypothetical protein